MLFCFRLQNYTFILIYANNYVFFLHNMNILAQLVAITNKMWGLQGTK